MKSHYYSLTFIFWVALLGGCTRQSSDAKQQIKPNVVETYVQGLQGDVKRAEASRDAANAATSKLNDELRQAGQAEGQ